MKSHPLLKKEWKKLNKNIFLQKRYPYKYKTLYNIKQIIRFYYGKINDNELKNIYIKTKPYLGKRSINFLFLLENRLDRILIKSLIFKTFSQVHQLIKHRYVFVNKQLVTSPNYLVNNSDIIEFDPKINNLIFENVKKKSTKNLIKKNFKYYKNFTSLFVDYKRLLIIINTNKKYQTFKISKLKKFFVLPPLLNHYKIYKMRLRFIEQYYNLYRI